jgi:uncharacterized membrane protein YsdA (DUF1294 family)/cold shock CspA family protein
MMDRGNNHPVKRPATAARFEGVIKAWHDDRGFGFIEPTQGGQEVFAHIKSFRGMTGRPQEGLRVTFEVGLGPQGKKRAARVEPVRVRRQMPTPRRRDMPAQWGTATPFAIPAFLQLLVVALAVGKPPRWTLGVYAGASVMAFMAYAMDKNAAETGAWRTPEKTLHLLAVMGGWPGALLAQQFLRHKSTKAEFRRVFWITVLANVSAFSALAFA